MSTGHRFGPFEILPQERLLLKAGQPLPIGARGLDLLLTLIAHRDRMVTKNELLDVVWPGLVVEEANVQVQVSGLRKLLGPSVIATIPGLGYRFAAALTSDADPAAGLPDIDRVPPAPVRALTNLPGAHEVLIGRDGDLHGVTAALTRSRVVSVLGPAGIGKTRVAHEVARLQLGRHADGVWWIDLAPLTQVGQLPTAIANATGLQLTGGTDDAQDRLLAALEVRSLLLVLDNCEHLVDAVGRFVSALIAQAPGAQVLVTSQALLRIPGEEVFRLDPLAVPPDDCPFEAAQGFGAWRLFEQRARAVDRRFGLGPAECPATIRLLRQLDGMPLAIEMAAARAPLLGLEALVARLGERLQLFRSASRHPLTRHATLRATLEWSDSMLDARAQSTMRGLSVFVGSFRVETAQHALADSALDEWQVLDALALLVDQSLVQCDGADPPRYRLLDTMRLFYAEQLLRSGDDAAVLHAHDRAIAALAARIELAYWEMGDAAWLALHAADHDELQATFDRARLRGDAEVAALTGHALMRLDHLRNVHSARSQRAAQLHAMLPQASKTARAWIWGCIASHGLIAVDEVSRLEAAHQAVLAWRAEDEPMRLHFALGFHATERARMRDFDDANRLIAEARALERSDWPVRRLMWGASAQAGVCSHQGDAAGYRDACRQELALALRAGADRAAAWARLKLADAALMAGECDEAVELGAQAVAGLRVLDQPANLGLALSNLCAALLMTGRPDPARSVAIEALPLMRRSSWAYLLLDSIALLAVRDGRIADAARLLGLCDAWYAAHADERQPNEAALARLAWAGIEAASSGAADPGVREAWRAEGRALGEVDAERLVDSILDPLDLTG